MTGSENIITLTTDFGSSDHYVAAMKAVILNIAPQKRLVDVSHNIPPQDVMAGAWVLKNSAFLFPSKTVHLVVVDPGVGTERKPIGLKIKNHYFVGPDNGIFSLLTSNNSYEATELTNDEFWNPQSKSSTFHGRDIFAPVAAHLSNNVPLTEMGEEIDELVSYRWALPIADDDGIQGWVLHIDRFGNLITNIPEDMIRDIAAPNELKIYVGNTILKELNTTFADVEEGEPLAYIGSSGMLEIAVNKGSAEQMLGVKKGASVSAILQK